MIQRAKTRSLRRKVALTLTLPLALLLSACTVESVNTIHADDTVTVVAKVNALRSEAPPDTSCQSIKDSFGKDKSTIFSTFTVTDNSDDTTLDCEFRTPEPRPLKALSGPGGSITHENGTYTLITPRNPALDNKPFTDPKFRDSLSKIDYTLKYEFPGEVIDPGTGIADGNNVIFNDYITVYEGYTIKAKDAGSDTGTSSSTTSSTATKSGAKKSSSAVGWIFVILLVFLVLVIIGAIVVIVLVLKKKSPAPSVGGGAGYYPGAQHGGGPAGGFPTGPGPGGANNPPSFPPSGQGVPPSGFPTGPSANTPVNPPSFPPPGQDGPLSRG